MWLAFLAATVLTWIPPTLNEDGTPFTDLANYEIYYGCSQSGVYDSVESVPASATTYTVTGISGTCYFAATAVNSQGVSSVYSDELVRTVSTELPGPVVDTAITWSESVMAVAFVSAGAVAIGPSLTPGLPAGLAEDHIMILHIIAEYEDENVDGQGDWGGTLIGSVTSGGSTGPNDKARTTLYWKRAGASESGPTIDDAGNSCFQSVITAWSGAITTGSPLSGTPVSTSSSLNTLTPSADGVTTADDGAMVIVTLGAGDDGVYSAEANGNLVSITEAFQANNANGSDSMFAGYYGIKTTAGATGATTATNSLSEEEAHWTIALKPPGGAPPSVVLGRHPIDGGMNPVQGGMQ